MITLKPGVDARILSPQIVLAIAAAAFLWDGVTVTSVNDGAHSGKPVQGTNADPHYLGLAVDMRLPANPREGADQLQAVLGSQYVVLLEATHIHVQYGHIA